MQRKLWGIINVDSDAIGQLRIIYLPNFLYIFELEHFRRYSTGNAIPGLTYRTYAALLCSSLRMAPAAETCSRVITVKTCFRNCSCWWMCHCADCQNVHGEWQCSAAEGGRSVHRTQTFKPLSTFRRYAVHSGGYLSFGVTPCSLVHLLTFRRYAAPAGKQLSTFRRYAAFTGTVMDVSALLCVHW
jgi:hypothetical protein